MILLSSSPLSVRRARNAAGLRYPEYWSGRLTPRPTVNWYMDRIDAAVDAAKRATEGAPITLLAHSAGGWLGRVYMKVRKSTDLVLCISSLSFSVQNSDHSLPT